MYDDEATQERNNYAWSLWSGWLVGCWIQQGNGPNSAGTMVDPPLVYFVGHDGNNLYRVGADPADDWGNPIPWMAQTGFVGFASPELIKDQHRLFINVESEAGAMFVAQLMPGRYVPANNEVMPYSTQPATMVFSPTQSYSPSPTQPSVAESFNDMECNISPFLQSGSSLLQLTEPGTSETGFELISWGVDVIEEAFTP